MRRLQPLFAEPLRASLAQVLRRSAEARFVHRAQAVVLVCDGRSCTEVAHWFGDTPRSVERWIHAVELGGPGALQEQRHDGRPPRMSPGQLQQLVPDLAHAPADCGYHQPRWSGKLLARHIANRYAITLSPRQCQRLLREFGHEPG